MKENIYYLLEIHRKLFFSFCLFFVFHTIEAQSIITEIIVTPGAGNFIVPTGFTLSTLKVEAWGGGGGGAYNGGGGGSGYGGILQYFGGEGGGFVPTSGYHTFFSCDASGNCSDPRIWMAGGAQNGIDGGGIVMIKANQIILLTSRPILRETEDVLAREHGKTFLDAKGDIQRGLEVVEFALGIPQLMKGEFTDGAGPGIDIYSMRQPLGVVAGSLCASGIHGNRSLAFKIRRVVLRANGLGGVHHAVCTGMRGRRRDSDRDDNGAGALSRNDRGGYCGVHGAGRRPPAAAATPRSSTKASTSRR